MARARAGQGAEDRAAAPDLHGRAHARLRADGSARLSAAWKLTVRAGSRVEHAGFDTLDDALVALRARAQELAGAARRETARAFVREVSPEEQVGVRLELRGPRRGLGPAAHGGLDLRGDGTHQAWTGRVRRRLVEPDPGEDAIAALGRALGSVSPAGRAG